MSKGTPMRYIRIDDDLWARVQAQAGAEKVSVSELVRGLLRGWLSGRQDNEGDK